MNILEGLDMKKKNVLVLFINTPLIYLIVQLNFWEKDNRLNGSSVYFTFLSENLEIVSITNRHIFVSDIGENKWEESWNGTTNKLYKSSIFKTQWNLIPDPAGKNTNPILSNYVLLQNYLTYLIV